MPEKYRPRLALLIDGENISDKYAEGLFAEVERLGDAIIRRVYGDFSQGSRGWAGAISRFAMATRHHGAMVPGKNGADIALVIDAMDLLQSTPLDGFCIVSSDSDFTGLAIRIREQGLTVYGFGQQKTPESFRNACHCFFLTDGFCALPDSAVEKPVSKPQAAAPPKPAGSNTSAKTKADVSRPGNKFKDVKKVLPRFRHFYSLAKPGGDWMTVADLQKELLKQHPKFDPRKYGCGDVAELVAKTNSFEIDGANGVTRFRAKAAKKNAQ